jgi:hypothetical protein
MLLISLIGWMFFSGTAWAEIPGLELIVEPTDSKIEVVETVGDKRTIRISHPDYVEQELVVGSSETEKMIFLVPKPSYLSFVVEPQDAKIEINGNEVAAVNRKILVSPGEKYIRIFKKDFFEFTDKVLVAPNESYPAKKVRLKSDSRFISPSDKKLSLRLEYNPFILQNDMGVYHSIPFAVNLEWYYLSIGVGQAYTMTRNEKTDEFGKKFRNEDRWSDYYWTARLISPRMGPFKFNLSATKGSSQHTTKSYRQVDKLTTTKNYQGVGGGLRIYLGTKWSMHAEYFHVQSEIKETDLRQNEDRILSGVAYEF